MVVAPTVSSQISAQLDVLVSVFAEHGLDHARQQALDKIEDLERPSELLVFVFGEGKFGKSSLINQLLGREVAEVSFLPKTWRIDLFRSVAPGEEEFALVRRAGVSVTARLSIAEAMAVCKEQEAARKQPQAGEGAAEDLHIVEIQWHYRGLALPPNVVLVDTPGFSQFREGLNQARTALLSNESGVVVDIQEVYERFFHRATVVLWAFKATKLEDRDTQEAFAALSQRGKQIVGALTYVDGVPPEQRPELMTKATTLYGDGVAEFLPVIAGGRSPELGLGVAELREKLAAFSPAAESVKTEEMARFCRFQAQGGLNVLKGLGDTLIHNVSHIALYCNAVSDRLLREARDRRDSLETKFAVLVGARVPGLDLYVRNALVEKISRPMRGKAVNRLLNVIGLGENNATAAPQQLVAQFREDLRAHLQLDALSTALREELERIGNFAVAQGAQIAVGHEMQQILLKAAGTYETQPLKARITPPNVRDIVLALPTFDVRVRSLDGILGTIETALLGGISEANILAAQQVVRKGITDLRSGIAERVSECTRRIAQAVLDSADHAIGELYPGETLQTLRDEADRADRNLRRLAEIVGEEALGEGTFRYGTLYRVWSPRDDARLAAIRLFCEWFDQEEEDLRREAATWLDSALAASPLEPQPFAAVCANYLQQTKQFQGVPYLTLSDIVVFCRAHSPTMSLNTSLETIRACPECRMATDLVQNWQQRVSARLRGGRLFDSQTLAERILQDFPYIYLEGLPTDFAYALSVEFETLFERTLASQPLDVQTELADDLPVRLQRGLPYTIGTSVAVASATDTGVLVGHLLPVLPIWAQVVGLGIPALASGGLIHRAALRKRWQKECLEDTHHLLTHKLLTTVLTVAHVTWEEAVRGLNPAMAERLVGSKTLVKKKPLDYALEGVLEFSP